ncbi:MAG: LPP20 family lipoprotein [Treponema sp.]|nr:LPP20 family lipoprotein [Treponema sp.]
MNKINRSITGIIILLLLSGLCLSSCASGGGSTYVPPSSGSSARGAPAWVSNPYSAVSEAQYVAAFGDGLSLEEAQYKSKANLLQVFGMKLSDESVIAETFNQTTTNNNTNWTETVSSNRKLAASAEGILVGCEIRETSQSGNNYYALAVMERSKAVSSYNDIIARLSTDISHVLNVPNMNTIDGYARNLVAAEFAKDIDACINVIRFVGGAGNVPAGLKSESQYKADANTILKSIPVNVVLVRGAEFDPENRIQTAFARAIGAVGFMTGTNTAPYVLEITLNLSEVVLDNPNKFSRYEITAALLDARTRQGVVPPWPINGREGHANYSEAQQRSVRAAEARINSEYKELLQTALDSLY